MSAATYQAILDAIDAAILEGVSGPGELIASGRTVKYRSLGELTAARRQYAALAAKASGKTGFKLTGMKAPGGRI